MADARVWRELYPRHVPHVKRYLVEQWEVQRLEVREFGQGLKQYVKVQSESDHRVARVKEKWQRELEQLKPKEPRKEKVAAV